MTADPTPTFPDDALCTQVDSELFFPDPSDKDTIAAAKAVCARCLVRLDCLSWALTSGDEHAVLGGTTPEERRTPRRVARAQRADLIRDLAGQGLSDRQIATRLGVDKDTVLRVRQAHGITPGVQQRKVG